ncbi:MAG TPA: hypothetical protein VM784_11045, partial [Actinomycetota bacterium]|nr:hypothetical protein [Actinomycetota bacterium]
GLIWRKDWALPTSVAINGLLVLLLWLAVLGRGSSGSFVAAAVWSLFWLLLTIHWLRQRSRRKQEQGADVDNDATQPKTPAPGEGWTREWGGGRVKFGLMLGFGALVLVAGVGIAMDGSVVEGISVLSFGIALVGAAPMFRAWDRRGRVVSAPIEPRGGEVGLLFPYSRSKMLAATAASLGMAVACGGIALGGTGDRGPGVVIFGIFGFLFFGAVGLLSILRSGFRGGYIALLEGGIYARTGVVESFVPWDAISSVEEVETRVYVRGAAVHEPFIGLMISDLDRVEISRMAKRFVRINRLLAADLSYPVRTLDVDPRRLLTAIRRYWRDPRARAELKSGVSESG